MRKWKKPKSKKSPLQEKEQSENEDIEMIPSQIYNPKSHSKPSQSSASGSARRKQKIPRKQRKSLVLEDIQELRESTGMYYVRCFLI